MRKRMAAGDLRKAHSKTAGDHHPSAAKRLPGLETASLAAGE